MALHELVGHPQVDQANGPVVAEKHVAGLQVVVDDLLAMQVVDGLAQPAHGAQRFGLFQPAALADAGGGERRSF